MSSERHLSVTVSYGDARVEFSGSPDVVLRSLHEFMAKEIPSIDLARSISVNYSLNDLIQGFRDYVRFTEEGPRVWLQENSKLSDKDHISLQLVAVRAAQLSGRSQTDACSIADLEAATGLNPKTIGSRLSELNKVGHVERKESDGGARYRITTTGIHWLHAQLGKKAKPAPPPQPVAAGAAGPSP